MPEPSKCIAYQYTEAVKCRNCGLDIAVNELTCPNCGKQTAQTKEDLKKTDPMVAGGIAWALIAMGAMGLVFVIANSWTDWYSGLDYVGPIGLLLIGSIALVMTRRKK